jgi:hypothetical protein
MVAVMKFRFGRANMNKDTPVFTVFGGAYVPEHHNDYGFDFEAKPQKFSDGPSWVVASSLVFALTFCAAEIVFFARLGSGLM